MRKLRPEEIARAGQITQARMTSLGLTPADVARAAHVDQRTVRRLIAGTHFPSTRICNALCEALGWPVGELWRQAVGGHEAMAVYTNRDLLHELVARARRCGDPDLSTYEMLLDHARAKDPTNSVHPSPSANTGQE